MDKLTQYQQLLSRMLTEYGKLRPAYGEIHTEVVLDLANNHFEVVRTGWLNQNRIHGAVIHVDIINEKFWIQYDGTDRAIADELVAAGVPKEDIGLAFQPENIRHISGFAVS
jgi:hypothetical protein